MKKIILACSILLLAAWHYNTPDADLTHTQLTNIPDPTPLSSPKLNPEIVKPDQSKIIPNNYHEFQTFNNCGPATLAMVLNYYGVRTNQKELGELIRPFQNPQGINDDKSTSMEEFVYWSEQNGLKAIHRPNGTIELLKSLVSNDFPVITRTWLNNDEDIGHFRVIRGFNESDQTLLQDDSYQNKNLTYSYSEFNSLWQPFNYEFVIIYPENKSPLIEAILGENYHKDSAWQAALVRSEKEAPNINTQFNRVRSLYYLDKYEDAVKEFEKIKTKLPSRMLWYQYEPIMAYAKLGNKEKVITLSDQIINHNNLAFSELYILRGDVYRMHGQMNESMAEYKKAILYNKNLPDAIRVNN